MTSSPSSPVTSNWLPLAEFIFVLATEGFSVGLSDLDRIALALQGRGKWTRGRFRGTLQALLVRDPSQETAFVRHFEAFFGPDLPPSEPLSDLELALMLEALRRLSDRFSSSPSDHRTQTTPSSDSTPMVKQEKAPTRRIPRHFYIVVVAVVLLLAEAAHSLFFLPDTDERPDNVDSPASAQYSDPAPPDPNKLASTEVTHAAVSLKRTYSGIPSSGSFSFTPYPEESAWLFRAWIAIGCLFVTLLYALVLLWRSRISKDKPAVWTEQGPRHFRVSSIGDSPAPRLDAVTLDRLAESLGYFRTGISGQRVDLRRSISASLRDGGLPSLVYEELAQLCTVFVLEDLQAVPRQWNPIAQELAIGLAMRGVSVITGSFRGSPTCFYTGDGVRIELEDIEGDQTSSLMLLFSDSSGLNPQKDRSTLGLLSRWPMLGWMELREPRAWDESTHLVQSAGVPIFPATRQGLLDVFSMTIHDTAGQRRNMRSESGLRPFALQEKKLAAWLEVFLGEALPWAQACAMMQPIPLGVADSIRRRFTPTLPTERIERLFQLPGTTSGPAGLLFSVPVQATLRRGFTIRWENAQQDEILRFFLEQIAAAKPSTSTSLSALAWELTLERVRLELDPEVALKRLSELSFTPIGAAVLASFEHTTLKSANVGGSGTAEGIPLRRPVRSRDGLQRLARLAPKSGVPRRDAHPVRGAHKLGLGLCIGIALCTAGWSLTSYFNAELQQSIPLQISVQERQQSPIAIYIETFDQGRWDGGERAMILDGQIADTDQKAMHVIRNATQRLVLVGGGQVSTIPLIPDGDPSHLSTQSMALAIRTSQQQLACQELDRTGLLTIIRCPDSPLGNADLQRDLWIDRLGEAQQSKRLLSVGLEFLGPNETEPSELKMLAQRLLNTHSVDVIYRIAVEDIRLASALEALRNELNPWQDMVQLVWWSSTSTGVDSSLKGVVRKGGAVLNLGVGPAFQWVTRIMTLLEPGSSELVSEEAILAATGRSSTVAHEQPIRLIRPLLGFGTIEITLVNPKHRPIGGTLSFSRLGNEPQVVASGKPRLLAAGQWQVVANSAAYRSMSRTVEVVADKSSKVAIMLQPQETEPMTAVVSTNVTGESRSVMLGKSIAPGRVEASVPTVAPSSRQATSQYLGPIALSPDGRYVAWGEGYTRNSIIVIRDTLSDGDPNSILTSGNIFPMLTLSGVGQAAWALDSNLKLHTDTLTRNNQFAQRTVQVDVDIRALAFASGGQLLALAGSKVSILSVPLRKIKFTLPDDAVAVAFSPDATLLATGGSSVNLWPVKEFGNASIQPISSYKWEFSDVKIQKVAVSMSNQAVAALGTDGTIQVWDRSTGESKMIPSADTLRTFAFSPKGALIITDSSDHAIHLKDGWTGKLLKTLSVDGQQLSVVTFSDDASTLAGVSVDNVIRLWHLDMTNNGGK